MTVIDDQRQPRHRMGRLRPLQGLRLGPRPDRRSTRGDPGVADHGAAPTGRPRTERRTDGRGGMSALRILVTGSRRWADGAMIEEALLDALAVYTTVGTPILVHGGANGADALAERAWTGLAEDWPGGLSMETYPADWDAHGRAAGPIRNEAMVASGATVCLAFPIGASPGTRGCMRLARAAGIPVIDHDPALTTQEATR